jgi:hypothetical protein
MIWFQLGVLGDAKSVPARNWQRAKVFGAKDGNPIISSGAVPIAGTANVVPEETLLFGGIPAV